MSEKDFLQFQAQTNPFPFKIAVKSARGSSFFDVNGKEYIDMIAGVAVNNIGHCHPKVVAAIKNQVDQHMHVMVYGEFIHDSTLAFTKNLTSLLPEKLNMVYPVNSGTEANEAAIKLVKRATGRGEIISFRGSYHGSTNGSLSISGNEIKKQAYRPLLPDVRFIKHNEIQDLRHITSKTAGVILETIQGDAGVRIPNESYLKALRQRCSEVGALLIFDEIQCGMGRTGKPFAFQHFDVIPDVLTLGKALGGGMPIGALVSSKELLHSFTHNPMLGHITTFGGNPVISAAANATLEVLQTEIDWLEVQKKSEYMAQRFQNHPRVIQLRHIGLMFAIDLKDADQVEKVVTRCLENGVLSFWFLSHPYSFRLSPPINIEWSDLEKAMDIILAALDSLD